MKAISAAEFEAVRRRMLQALGPMSSQNAKGFLVDLDHALGAEAGLNGPRVKWRGGDDSLFSAHGGFAGDADQAAARILACLDDVAYDPAQAVATATLNEARVRVSFATWASEVGLATVQIEIASGASSGDIPAP